MPVNVPTKKVVAVILFELISVLLFVCTNQSQSLIWGILTLVIFVGGIIRRKI